MHSISPQLICTNNYILREINPLILTEVLTNFDDTDAMNYLNIETLDLLSIEKNKFKKGITSYHFTFLYFQILNKISNEILGWCGFHTYIPKHQKAEIGYVITNQKNWGKGIMKEVLPVVLDYGFKEMNLYRIEAMTAVDNYVSKKLLQNNGFIYEGLLRKNYLRNQQFEDSEMYSLLNTEFSNL
jgi:ribosomal-protein-alanine N-acetyltransferase